MSENRKYYYLKLKENFFTSEKMVILESMQDGLLYSNLLLKMYLMSLKYNGILMLNDRLPHTPQTIATFTRHQIGTVERAIKVFMEFSLVEILTDGAFYMTDIQLLIGQSSTEGERKKRERTRLQRQNLLPAGGVDKCPPYSRGDICPPEIRDKRLDIRDKSIESEAVSSARAYGQYQNVFLSDAELAELQSELPTLWQTNELRATQMEELECWCKECNLSLREGMEEIITMYYEAAGFWPDVLKAEIESMSDDELMKAYLNI